MKLKISIITPVFNAAKTIERCIKSVLNQDAKNLEHIVINSCSTDGTTEIISSYNNIHHICEKDSGIYDGMNKGLALASGDIIGILNSDDFYMPQILNEIRLIFENNPHIDIVHGNINSYENEKLKIVEKPYPENLLYITMCLKHPSCFVRKNIYNKIGLFDTNFKISADYDFLLRAYISGHKFHYENKILVNFQRGGMSDKNKFIGIYENFLVRKKNKCKWLIFIGVITPIYGFFLKSIFRKIRLFLFNFGF